MLIFPNDCIISYMHKITKQNTHIFAIFTYFFPYFFMTFLVYFPTIFMPKNYPQNHTFCG